MRIINLFLTFILTTAALSKQDEALLAAAENGNAAVVRELLAERGFIQRWLWSLWKPSANVDAVDEMCIRDRGYTAVRR